MPSNDTSAGLNLTRRAQVDSVSPVPVQYSMRISTRPVTDLTTRLRVSPQDGGTLKFFSPDAALSEALLFSLPLQVL